ncbi:uncharacterized protein BDCG_02948 [Blastomyces dermatitidis ER-3]|uniref:Uncharacterized protein n=1 Tax=Ajellomyces dermatitidis (strain ER-3 / ATCC MYA-2586) TaxID=559297 RepID=A0ABP2EYU6_AJEDR|nr:uncharacterized protein BDCG_02948 [Blastomyces dermatitidis ER-3]EEQ87828.2 hypothetical protein BDCG_02948 [Blastomyces dermatitidis ER-3]
MYEIMKHVQRLADYLDKNSVTVSNSSSSNEKFDNSDNSLLISLTDTSTTAVDSFSSFFFNLSTSVDSLAMSSTETLNILDEKFSEINVDVDMTGNDDNDIEMIQRIWEELQGNMTDFQ